MQVKLGEMHEEGVSTAISQRLATVVPQILTALLELDDHGLEISCMMLAGKPCIWIGNGFTASDRVALM